MPDRETMHMAEFCTLCNYEMCEFGKLYSMQLPKLGREKMSESFSVAERFIRYFWMKPIFCRQHTDSQMLVTLLDLVIPE